MAVSIKIDGLLPSGRIIRACAFVLMYSFCQLFAESIVELSEYHGEMYSIIGVAGS